MALRFLLPLIFLCCLTFILFNRKISNLQVPSHGHRVCFGKRFISTLSATKKHIKSFKISVDQCNFHENHKAAIEERFSNLFNLQKNLTKSVEEMQGNSQSFKVCPEKPTLNYEESRRYLKRDIKEAFWFFQNLLIEVKMRQNISTPAGKKEKRLNIAYGTLVDSINLVAKLDQFNTWRHREMVELSSIAQGVINDIQNPKNCSQAKIILCKFINFGLGYSISFFQMCFLTAYRFKRMLVIAKGPPKMESRFAHFTKSLSDSCPYPDISDSVQLRKLNSSKMITDGPRVIYFDIHKLTSHEMGLLDIFALPKNIADRITLVSDDPYIWWTGQLLLYMMRPTEHLEKIFQETKKKFRALAHPYVGIHVRRSDKITEAKYQSSLRYLKIAESFFQDNFHGTFQRKNLYLASEDVSIKKEILPFLDSFNFSLTENFDNVKIGNNTKLRSQLVGLLEVFPDIFMLSEADYLVCTFSSNLSRMIVQIMATKWPDIKDRYYSLDMNWLLHSKSFEYSTLVAIQSHKPHATSSELQFEPGDLILLRHHFSKDDTQGGFNSYGTNIRTNQFGRIAIFKTRPKKIPYLQQN